MKFNLIGQRFSMLFVDSLAPRKKWGPDGKSTGQHWICKCDCGNKTLVRGTHLTRGDTISCGCVRRKKRSDHHNWTGYGEISGNFFYSIKKHAIDRNLSFHITIEDVWKLFLMQNRRCSLTDLELSFPLNGRDRNGTASLDRIDSSKGYTLDNVQWVHKDINIMKMDLTTKQFLDYCALIFTKAKQIL